MKKHLLLTLSLLLALSGPARASVVEILGDGNTETVNNYLPTHTLYNFSLSQQIYTAAEIGKKGNITSIAFYITRNAHTRNLSIYMTHTDKTSFTDDADWVPIDEYDCVFSGDVAFVDEEWTTIEFDTPFDYDGSSNLLIAVGDNTGEFYSSISQALVFPTEEVMSHCTYTDGASIALEPRSNWEDYKVKNQIKLDIEENSHPRPTDVTVSDITTTTATFAWTTNGEETEWDILVTDVETDNTTTKRAKTNPYTIAGLDEGTAYTVQVRAFYSKGETSEWSKPVPFMTSFCDAADQQVISYQLFDSYGDGWNGNAIVVKDHETGIVLGKWTFDTGNEASGTLAVCVGRQVDFEWRTDYYADECYYAVYDAEGHEIFYGEGELPETVEHVVGTALSDLHTPSGLGYDEVAHTFATLYWQERGEATQWQLCLNDDEENLITANETPFTLTPLSPETAYTVKVRAVEGSKHGPWSSHLSFQTLEASPTPFDITCAPTQTTATLEWNGYSDNYLVRYRMKAHTKVGTTTFFENFQNDTSTSWKSIDNASDGASWSRYMDVGLWDGFGLASECPDDDSDNWLITPQLDLGGCMRVWLKAQEEEEPFAIYLSTSGAEIEDFTIELVGETVATDKWTPYTADLTSYAGQKGYIAVRHFNSTNHQGLFLDEFGLYNEAQDVPAGEWKMLPTSSFCAVLKNLQPDTPYEFSVQGFIDGEPSAESAPIEFRTLPEDVKAFTEAGRWDVADNWSPAGIPTADDDVVIYASATIPSGTVAEARTITVSGGDILLQDGAQLHHATSSVPVTFEKHISGYGDTKGGYQFFATPYYSSNIYPDEIEGMLTDNYDLYWFLPDYDYEWFNYKRNSNFCISDFSENILYASKDDTTLSFNIETCPSNKNRQLGLNLSYNDDAPCFKGWNPFGNPFTCNAYVCFAVYDDVMEKYVEVPATFYKLNAAGDGYEKYENRIELKPCEGALVQYDTDGTICFYTQPFDEPIPAGQPADYAPALPEHDLDEDLDATPTLNLAAYAENSQAIEKADGKIYNVVLQGRTLKKDGSWNPLYLPFDVTLEGSPLEGADVKRFESTMMQENGNPVERTLELYLMNVAEITAGQPCYLRWTSGEDEVNPTFRDVTIQNVHDPITRGYASCCGSYDAQPLPPGDAFIFFNGTNQYTTDATVPAFHAIFALMDGYCLDPAADKFISKVQIDFNDGEGFVTAINDAKANTQRDDAEWFLPDGRKVGNLPNQHGLYISRGKKVAVRR